MRKRDVADKELMIAAEDPAQPEIIQLLRDGEAHSAELYPAESNHHLPLGRCGNQTCGSSWAASRAEPSPPARWC